MEAIYQAWVVVLAFALAIAVLVIIVVISRSAKLRRELEISRSSLIQAVLDKQLFEEDNRKLRSTLQNLATIIYNYSHRSAAQSMQLEKPSSPTNSFWSDCLKALGGGLGKELAKGIISMIPHVGSTFATLLDSA